MPVCLGTALATVVVTAQAFTLAWTHSIEKQRWEEDWRVERGELVLDAVRVKGHGAGMEPPSGAVLHDGVWEWQPRSRHAALLLTRSEFTADYEWCVAGAACVPMSAVIAAAGDVTRVSPCGDPAGGH